MQRPWLELRIISRRIEAQDIVALTLAAPDGSALPAFSAGSHIDVEVSPGLIRQYSLCNDPAGSSHYEIAVLRDPASRGGSIAIQEGFGEGDTIRVSEPRNHFPLQPVRGKALLMAGGIGVTPLLCMAERLSATGADFALHYCARTPARTAFRDRIAASRFADRVRYHFDDGPDGQRLDPAALFANCGEADVYVCGPAGFIDWICSAATAAGIAQDRVHREYFSAVPAEPVPGGDLPFRLRIASSGETIEVAADESAAAALARHGIELPISCEQGICGTCITRVIEGEPDHRDMLMLDGNSEFTPCCSRALTPELVIDL
ncbi:PDR/VanB family oxidoreductase [Sphingomonas canadensis]|uniref:PDR/VanB family oxidoreductase n=1 Tax=Sphingomonas canadensis TaxID=1219257 RepID=A0ABW3HA50_9SPHN|nr:PDR/VanB family oxidoreductase [Sphingomonas canadensis]MCW3837626.1 PDR/VanB family oxidoreductase [Sphingomonas canadensis]